MAYRVDTVTADETLPAIAGATILSEAPQSFTRLVLTGGYDRVPPRDDKAGCAVGEWRRQGLDSADAGPGAAPAATLD